VGGLVGFKAWSGLTVFGFWIWISGKQMGMGTGMVFTAAAD